MSSNRLLSSLRAFNDARFAVSLNKNEIFKYLEMLEGLEGCQVDILQEVVGHVQHPHLRAEVEGVGGEVAQPVASQTEPVELFEVR